MNKLLSDHRAACGIASVAAIAVYFLLPSLWPVSGPGYLLSRLIVVLVAAVGLFGILRSPYWKIVYREAPLRRAITGVSDLDERELALRDRAHGLTYYLFVVANMLLLLGVGIAADLGWIALAGESLIGAIFPYSWFAVSLPVIMIEWFEPSGLASAAEEDEA